ncbi:MAG: hypothetical protein HETSPECPRED_001155 [Heterodermia speciosa]|uniref:Rad4 beta-hairpin domain-containing protein n=1 Tax=Heterodermia speciosa TaxID=116794 RepID=A0A8H3J104_9LECA|nr:MAG: hypothetical protein HETSPECPRED_001155 [Heterodermia speciosa]
MPPFIARKRWRSKSPQESPKPKKSSLFEAADEPHAKSTLQDNKAFLEKLNGSNSDTSLSDVNSSDFEDVEPPNAKKRKIEHDEGEDEIDWEDAMQDDAPKTSAEAPGPTGDLVLTLGAHDPTTTAMRLDKKKGPNKIERQIRTATHCMHVQFLLFHNLVRNGWACDKRVQETLVGHLPPGVKKEVERWRSASGIETQESEEPRTSYKRQSKTKSRGSKASENVRSQREWGKPAERQEKGAPNMSSADPVIRLLKVLAAYWKKRFTVTAPSLRKQGYKSLAQLEVETSSFKTEKHDQVGHGERIEGIEVFRKCAKSCEGSRDIGVQLFAALIRGLGIEARLVASLQPVGFGWTKNEEASAKKKNKASGARDPEESSSLSSSGDEAMVEPPTPTHPPKSNDKRKSLSKQKTSVPIELSDDGENRSSDESVIDITPSVPRKKPNMHYDRDLAFPTYWIEAISPITNEVYPVDPFILNPAVATNSEYLSAFESRGAKADKAKQVFAYIVAYSPDGTAKEVTTRYLKRHMWSGRTKGVRIPIEKVPVYNKRGKIKHHEEYDWFKTVMSGYKRPYNKRTAVDDLEDAKDLKPLKPEKKEKKEGDETLQGYKTSADYVLERHLRREEAILPSAEPVKTFTTGKGDNAKEEPVYLRKDVMVCRTGESWHKEGRQIKVGETPMKMVPVRAVTLTRKREVEEAQREGGEKLKQGLYAWDQTEWIIPPPIENGVIPKNAFGNMDCYVPTMVPKGAVHIPLRSTMKICKRLGIDYAEAVTGFEFGKQRAVPVITGVVVAAENEDLVIDEWEKDEEERRRKEDEKREKAALAGWRKMIMGLRIYERVRNEYGGDEANPDAKEASNPFTRRGQDSTRETASEDNGGVFVVDAADREGGGFLPEGYPDDEPGGFLPNEQPPERTETPDPNPLQARASETPTLLPQTTDPPNRPRTRPPKPSPQKTAPPNHEAPDPSRPQPPQTAAKKRGRPPNPSSTKKPLRHKDTKSLKPETKGSQKPTPAGPAEDIGDDPPAEPKARRRSARNNVGKVRSRYFEGGSGGEDD